MSLGLYCPHSFPSIRGQWKRNMLDCQKCYNPIGHSYAFMKIPGKNSWLLSHRRELVNMAQCGMLIRIPGGSTSSGVSLKWPLVIIVCPGATGGKSRMASCMVSWHLKQFPNGSMGIPGNARSCIARNVWTYPASQLQRPIE